MSVTPKARLAGRWKATEGNRPRQSTPGCRSRSITVPSWPADTRPVEPATNGKCLTRVYRVSLHEIISVINTTTTTSSISCSSSSIKCDADCQSSVQGGNMGTFSILFRMVLRSTPPIFSFVLIFFRSFSYFYWTTCIAMQLRKMQSWKCDTKWQESACFCVLVLNNLSARCAECHHDCTIL